MRWYKSLVAKPPSVSDAELVGPLRTLLQRAALAASLALLFGATLRPVGGPNHVALAPWAPRELDAVNVVGNVVLFALPAAVLMFFGWSLRRTVVAGFALSLGIELLQLAVPGRTTATTDVLCNTIGAAVGWLVAASSPDRSRRVPESSPPSYDAVADAYGRARDPEGTGLDDPVLTELVGDVGGQVVLSLACGQGQDARLLARLGATVTGIDISPEMLRRARRHEADNPRGIAYTQGNAQELTEFADASFDGVLCHMALMDIPELSPTIRSVARVLRARGWFVFSIVHPAYHPHVESLTTDYVIDHRYQKRLPVDWLPEHAYHRSLATYVNELAQAGFRIGRFVEIHQRDTDAGGVPGLLYARAAKL